ncbi:MAG TPA: NYN domain-containing protein [Cyanobacteria bacterium UBA12227]|nr:NYN domain-containing protein [Cyanobacteria bacterium UBA12227]HAX88279.1 NYN domain-containing protein [Cyanobacteria bacterium UBA11370]HBY81700.1 NYN domain-containing protein [Cyanobacteria bacterium UBA11148]
MNYNHLASVCIYCDLQNVLSIRQYIDQVLNFAKSPKVLISAKLYYNSSCKNQVSAQKALKRKFTCIDVPCHLKNTADNQLIAECIKDINNNKSLDVVIIVSGDGDFADLVGILKKLGKKVIIFAQRGNVKQKLKELADEFYFLEELPQLVVDKTEIKENDIQSQINYTDALEYLIQAIETALNKGKTTALGYINSMMRQLFPNYQDVSSICKPDGKKFAKFSKFVDAAVADGKVRMQNQKLFLIEADKLVM